MKESQLQEFYQGARAQILCESDGTRCQFNQLANQLFGDTQLDHISELFPDILTPESRLEGEYQDRNQKKFYLEFSHFSATNNATRYIISINDDEQSEWQKFSHFNQQLHQVYLDLSQIDNEHHLFKRLIELAIDKLDLDRVGILLLDHDTNDMLGTWGIDEQGDLVDTSHFRKSIPEAPWVEKSLKAKDYVFVNYNAELEDNHKVYGKGWNSMAAFWDKDKPIGWIASDNLFSHKPLPLWKKELLGELARVTGQLVVRLRGERELRAINDHLNTLVEARTQELRTTISELQATQNELIESEKMASLGSLVAGVSHEVNTPLGVALTSSSFIQDGLMALKNSFEKETLSEKELLNFLADGISSSEIMITSISRASNIVKSFKMLAIDQCSDKPRTFNLRRLVQNILTTLIHNYHDHKATINNNIPEDLPVYASAANYSQIVTYLIQNSLLHGFDAHQNGTIEIRANVVDSQLKLSIEDNGKGVKEEDFEQIFQPFYTTKRLQGGTGLGLSIVFNMVSSMKGSIRPYQRQPTGLGIEITLPLNSED